jgi:hypothetical protein
MKFMSTPTPPSTTATTTSGTTPAPAAKTPKHHGVLNKSQLAEISYANIIYGVANSDPAILTQIGDTDIITPAFMTTLGSDLESIGQYTGGTTQATVEGGLKTTAEDTARTVLLAKIHYIQSKAKIKYAGNHGVLPEYSVGTNIDASRAVLETAADNVFNKLKTDTLPKITAQHSTDLKAASDTYKQTKVDQKGQQGDAITLRNQLATMVDSLALRRRQLQNAADGEYPFTDPANAGMRKKFDLPADRPLNA